MIVTFCGHSEIWDAEPVRLWLHDTVETLITDGANDFLLGGYGAFDRMAAKVVWELKQAHPEITSTLVIPYLDRKMDNSIYDGTTYPPLENVPRRFAISKRNEWMVRSADIVVAYVLHDYGGAAATLAYAERKRKRIIKYMCGCNDKDCVYNMKRGI